MLLHMYGPLRLSYALIANYVPKCQMSSGPYRPIFPYSDPSVASFSIDTAGGVFQQGVPLTINIMIAISNKGTGTYDDIKTTMGVNYNFAFELQLTDKDWPMDATADTTVPGLVPTLTDSERQQALATSRDILYQT